MIFKFKLEPFKEHLDCPISYSHPNGRHLRHLRQTLFNVHVFLVGGSLATINYFAWNDHKLIFRLFVERLFLKDIIYTSFVQIMPCSTVSTGCKSNRRLLLTRIEYKNRN